MKKFNLSQKTGMTKEFIDEILFLCLKHNIQEEFVTELSSLLLEFGAPEIYLRDKKIKMEYDSLKNKITSKKARILLAEKYFTGIKNIERIIYDKK